MFDHLHIVNGIINLMKSALIFENSQRQVVNQRNKRKENHQLQDLIGVCWKIYALNDANQNCIINFFGDLHRYNLDIIKGARLIYMKILGLLSLNWFLLRNINVVIRSCEKIRKNRSSCFAILTREILKNLASRHSREICYALNDVNKKWGNFCIINSIGSLDISNGDKFSSRNYFTKS